MKIGRRIKALRMARELTRAQLAHQAHLSRVHVARIERDEISPTLNTLERLAKALLVSVRELVDLRRA